MLRRTRRRSIVAMERLSQRIAGLRYAGRILLGGAIVWLLLASLGRTDPLWAIISVVVVTDPQLESALIAFRSRLINTLIGCAIGLSFLFVFHGATFSLLLAMATSIIIASDLVRVPLSWRIAPITVAIVMTPAVLEHSSHRGLQQALTRTGEVLLGSAVAVGVTYATSMGRRSKVKREFQHARAPKETVPQPPDTQSE